MRTSAGEKVGILKKKAAEKLGEAPRQWKREGGPPDLVTQCEEAMREVKKKNR
jgi:hypothetical protein